MNSHPPTTVPRTGISHVRSLLNRISLVLRMIAGALIVVIMVVTGVDVVMRYIFLRPLEWSLAIAMLGLVVVVLFALPHITATSSHISMDLFYRNFTERGKLISDTITQAALLMFSSVVGVASVFASWEFFTQGLRTAGSFNVPVWIGYAVVAVGLLVTATVVTFAPWGRTEPALEGEEIDGGMPAREHPESEGGAHV